MVEGKPPSSSLLSRIGGGPAITMGLVVSASIGAVYYSHYAQVRDKAVMRAGVERDKERLRMIRREQRKKQKEEEQQ